MGGLSGVLIIDGLLDDIPELQGIQERVMLLKDIQIDVRVPFGSIERWLVKNETDEDHTIHIHQIDFQVVRKNREPIEFFGQQDTENIPARGELELLMDFTDPVIVGRKFVFHCHILKHEDRGMMAVVEVFDSSTSSDATSNSSATVSDRSSDRPPHSRGVPIAVIR